MFKKITLTICILFCSGIIGDPTSMDHPERKIRELNPKDSEWLERSNKIGYDILDWYNKNKELNPGTLDSAFQKWKSDKTDNKAPENLVAVGLGSLFGKYIKDHKRCRWVVVTDSFGTDFALLNETGSELYPINSVWKRIDSSNQDISFFEPIWTSVVEKEFENSSK
ncbi:DUF3806 domain-containing protein [Leptospira brenneri]|uniref:DUF3806 domain-containing protein n=1 Tax=Leptospira brenneri TaxID=2023182 RepID=A0A5F1ZC05_9LEPT|nr:DUF3806 domain-containing protein [Leptospira brenneri]TGK96257.1 DUF3806 domain-containing protein [Leptospira brenneri]